MLVLSRHRDEVGVIDLRKFGLGIGKITVIDIRGDKVRLGLDFDAQIPVHRLEVWEAIERSKQEPEAVG